MKQTYICANTWCRDPFEARVADRKRGWARFCSKSCKAKVQEGRTGQHKANLAAQNDEIYFPLYEDKVQE